MPNEKTKKSKTTLQKEKRYRHTHTYIYIQNCVSQNETGASETNVLWGGGPLHKYHDRSNGKEINWRCSLFQFMANNLEELRTGSQCTNDTGCLLLRLCGFSCDMRGLQKSIVHPKSLFNF
jgi:hypothetical protein